MALDRAGSGPGSRGNRPNRPEPSSAGRDRRSATRGADHCRRGCDMAFPTDVPVIDTMIGFPTSGTSQYDFIRKQTQGQGVEGRFEFPAAVHVQARPQRDAHRGRPGERDVGRDGPLQHPGRPGRLLGSRLAAGAQGVPRPVRRVDQLGRPEPGDGEPAADRAGARAVGHPRGDRLPVRVVPAGRDQRQEDVPDLCQVRGARPADLLLRRRARVRG